MDLIQLLFTTIRRWYITLPILVVTALVGSRMSGEIQPEYSASASYLVIGPGINIKDVEGVEIREEINPFLSASGSLNFMADVLQISLMGDRVVEELEADGWTGGYAVEVNGRSPVLTIRTSASNAPQADGTLVRLGELLIADLEERQSAAGAPQSERMELVELSSEASAPDSSRQLQAKVMVGILGVAVAALAAGAFDGMVRALRRRRARRRASLQADSQESSEPPSRAQLNGYVPATRWSNPPKAVGGPSVAGRRA